MLVVLIATTSLLAEGEPTGALVWQRDALAAGEGWRLISAHAVHLSASHLMMNLLGLVLITEWLCDQFSVTEWGSLLLVSALGVSGALWVWQPQLQWYAGLSGVLYGLWAGAASLRWFVTRQWMILLALIALVVRLATGDSSAVDFPVVPEAHGYGAVSGLCWAVCRRAHHQFAFFD